MILKRNLGISTNLPSFKPSHLLFWNSIAKWYRIGWKPRIWAFYKQKIIKCRNGKLYICCCNYIFNKKYYLLKWRQVKAPWMGTQKWKHVFTFCQVWWHHNQENPEVHSSDNKVYLLQTRIISLVIFCNLIVIPSKY